MIIPTKMLPGLGFILIAVAGCGDGEPKGIVTGKATYKGAPVTTGTISFRMPTKGIVHDARLDAAGAFTMPDALPVGTYKVCYVPPAPEPVDPARGKAPLLKSPLPKKFEDVSAGGLSVTVQEGANEVPIKFE